MPEYKISVSFIFVLISQDTAMMWRAEQQQQQQQRSRLMPRAAANHRTLRQNALSIHPHDRHRRLLANVVT